MPARAGNLNGGGRNHVTEGFGLRPYVAISLLRGCDRDKASAALSFLTKRQQLQPIFAQQLAFNADVVANPHAMKPVLGFLT